MFSFITRNLMTVAAPTGSTLPTDTAELPPASADNASPAAERSVYSPSSSSISELAQAQLHLRTPSSSVNTKPEPADEAAGPSSAPTVPLGATNDDDTREDNLTSVPSRPEPTPEALSTLVESVPAKTLHRYVLSRLPNAEEPILQALSSFLESLTPPPKLHCVRCHKDYTEVENDDRSCLVAHDDESAEVERVGLTAEVRRTSEAPASSYQTLWGCCGKVTEGDGSHGPPDGWCYEGRHTTDIKRARFRTDSTPQDDKLVSCLRLNCHNIRDTLPYRTRRRARAAYKEESDEDESEGASDSGMEEITGVKNSKKGRRKSTSKASETKGKAKEKGTNSDAMDVDGSSVLDSASRTGSVRGKSRKAAASAAPIVASTVATAQLETETASAPPATATSTPAPKRPRGRPRKHPLPTADDASPSASASTPAPKRPRGRPRKSAPTPQIPSVSATATAPSATVVSQPAPFPASLSTPRPGASLRAALQSSSTKPNLPVSTSSPNPTPMLLTASTLPPAPADPFFAPPATTLLSTPVRASAQNQAPAASSGTFMIRQTPVPAPVPVLAATVPSAAQITSAAPPSERASGPAPAPNPAPLTTPGTQARDTQPPPTGSGSGKKRRAPPKSREFIEDSDTEMMDAAAANGGGQAAGIVGTSGNAGQRDEAPSKKRKT